MRVLCARVSRRARLARTSRDRAHTGSEFKPGEIMSNRSLASAHRAVATSAHLISVILALLYLSGCATAPPVQADHKPAAHSAAAADDALYRELSGTEGITKVVDNFLA